MPRGDNTGPAGMGPMTGRAKGFCSGFNAPGFMNQGPWQGGFRNRGNGWGNRGCGRNRWGQFQANPVFQTNYVMPNNPEIIQQQEIDYLKNQAQNMEAALNQVRNRIQEIGKQKTSE